MCGIAGFIAPEGCRADQRVLERMVAAVRHRGPDSVGYRVDGRVAIGAARLSVIDPTNGDQPLPNEDASVHVVLNGEIYNFRALTDTLRSRGHLFRTACDTEVLAHAWEEYERECVDHLNGMFGFALWDRRRRTLFLARDRMGEKPLYYAQSDGWFVFASELRGVLAHPAVGRTLDPRGLARYLAFDYVPDPHSIVQGVCKLRPAHSLTVSDDKIFLRRYWEMSFDAAVMSDEAGWREQIRVRFDDAVRSRLVSDVPLGCFLSGGIDSTAVAATAARERAGIRTFSVGYPEAAYDERPFARLAAERLGSRHEELVVSGSDAAALLPHLGELLDEPIADMSFVPLHLLSRAARGSVTVSLTGDGGDELFAGYPSMAAHWWQRVCGRLPALVRRGAGALAQRLSVAPEPLLQFLGSLEYSPEAGNQALVGGLLPRRHARLLSAETRESLGGFDPYTDVGAELAESVIADPTARLIHAYCRLYLAGQNLANADRASMAVGLELRAPFLDHRLVELMGHVPSRLKLHGFADLKGLLKRALADRLPPEILARGKRAFSVPVGPWFRAKLADPLRQILAPERIRAAGVFDPVAVARLVREHVGGARDHRRVLWSLVVFELWRAHHLDGSRATGRT